MTRQRGRVTRVRGSVSTLTQIGNVEGDVVIHSAADDDAEAWRAMCEHAIAAYRDFGTQECYIPLRALVDHDRHQPEGSGDSEVAVDLEAYVRSQIASGGKRHIAILGDYGCGKTLFCQKLAAGIAKQYLIGVTRVVPLLVPLRGLHKARSLRALIADSILDSHGVSLSKASLHERLTQGELLLILDGLDELCVVPTEYARAEIIADVLECLAASSVGIVTSRTHFFESQHEVEKHLGYSTSDSLLGRLRARLMDKAMYGVLAIQGFDSDDINRYLQFYFGTKTATIEAQIAAVHDFRDLAKRPILLRLIRETWEYLPGGSEINRLTLYETYVRIWWEREERRLLVPKDKLERALMRFALTMLLGKTQGLSLRRLHALLQSQDRQGGISSEAVGRCMGTCTFLNRDGAGLFHFIHRSFAEYFAAKQVVAELVELDFSSFSRKADMSWMPDNLTRFVADELRNHPQRDVVVRYLLWFVRSQATWCILHGWLVRIVATLFVKARQLLVGRKPAAYFPFFGPGLCLFHSPCAILIALGDLGIAKRVYWAMLGGIGNAWHTIRLEGDERREKFSVAVVERAIRERRAYTYSI